MAPANHLRDRARPAFHPSLMPPAKATFWTAAGSSLLLLAWFGLFLVDGLHNDVQRVAAVLVGASAAALAGHAGAVWKEARLANTDCQPSGNC